MKIKIAGIHGKLWVTVFAFISLIVPQNGITQDTATLKLDFKFLEDPPYKCSWLPWVDTRFVLEIFVCNLSDSILAIPRFAPCNDCNPKIFLADTKTQLEPKRTYELDVLYYFDDREFCELNGGDCYVDTIDFAKYVEWDLSSGSSYRAWLEYEVESYHKYKDTTTTTRIWRGKIVSDTLEFLFD